MAALTAAGLAGLAGPATASPAAAGVPGAVPPNQAARSAVGLAFGPTGWGYAFYRGAGDAVYLRTFYNAGKWSAQRAVGGRIVGAPAATVRGTTVIVAARGTDNALWLRMRSKGTWGRWTSWGGTLTASPAITTTRGGSTVAFVRGKDNALWSRTLSPGGKPAAWKRLGGILSSAPAATEELEVAAAGKDHAVWLTWAGDGWKWRSLRGRTYSAPAIAYIPETNGARLLMRGTDNALWVNGVGGGDSTGWKKKGGTLIDAPTAAGTRKPTAYTIAAVRFTDNAVWTTVSTGGEFSGFTRTWLPAK